MMITDAQSDFARQELIKAFYLPNGVLKEVAAKQEEVSTGKTETALDYKSAVVQGAFAASVPVVLNQVKQKAIPKPLPQADPVGGSPAPEEPEKPKSKSRTRIKQAIAAGGPLAKTVTEQEAEHGEEVVEEALELLRTDRWKEIPQRGLEALRNLCRNLKKINSNPRWQTFKFDPADGGKVSLKTIDEAIAGVECEGQGLLQGPLTRSPNEAEEFIDAVKLAWDVKTPPSYAINGQHVFNAERFVEGIKGEYLQNENIIINITKLTEGDLSLLYKSLGEKLSTSELLKTVIVHVSEASMSKNCEELLKYLRG